MKTHIPGALNCPVLDNSERALVGTIYKQTSSFDAKKTGAALVSANIARHLRERFSDRPREWRPLVYCWRGGGRSDAFAHVLAQIGWRVGRLEGGYKAYRRAVVAELETLPQRFDWRVVCGMTGTGKSRTLRALATAGSQVLDLEALAAHRGSVLGNMPDAPQPAQKMFDSLVWSDAHAVDPTRPCVEAESKNRSLRVADALIEACGTAIVGARCAAALTRRAAQREYAHYIAEPHLLAAQLECSGDPSKETRPRALARMAREDTDKLVEELWCGHTIRLHALDLKHYPPSRAAPLYTLRVRAIASSNGGQRSSPTLEAGVRHESQLSVS